MKELDKNGFIVAPNILSLNQTQVLVDSLLTHIKTCAAELDTSFGQYIYCTGRWANPSSVTDIIPINIDEKIMSALNFVTQLDYVMKKKNVICKSEVLKDEVPFHQDISYSYDSPYSLSVWLALNDVYMDSGPLQVIPGSHKWPIKPAIDFWSPSFIDKIRTNKEFNNNIVDITINAGDAIIFDSRLWHGSREKYDSLHRFAYVTRWVKKAEKFPKVPKPIPDKFGMWTCDQITYGLLTSKLKSFNKYSSNTLDIDYLQLIETWKQTLNTDALIQIDNLPKALEDLNNLLILKKASLKHNAGDLSGKLYKNLWNSLLNYI
jgi:ectoine hydroxylase-related dioxygenase (phytanoyl-CoA dioxygenase family)